MANVNTTLGATQFTASPSTLASSSTPALPSTLLATESGLKSTLTQAKTQAGAQAVIRTDFSLLDMHHRKKLKQMWKRNRVRKTRPVYWRRLVEVGVPVQVADVLAKAIAQYDAVRQVPNTSEQKLINEYCRFLCRAELWRSQLLTCPLSYAHS